MGRVSRFSVALIILTASFGFFFARDLLVRGQGDATGTTSWPQVELSLAVSGTSQPTYVTNAGDGTSRLFVVERSGRILLVKNGTLLPAPFLDIRGRVGSGNSEQGLLSVAFPPQYASKAHFYMDYTDINGDTVVARYRLTSDPDVADPNSEQVILGVQQPFVNHNGGQLAFGPKDGYLYIGMGDGGSGGDPGNRAQNPAELLGKILRLDVEGANVATYSIPPDNPFTQTSGYRGEIWALGLRNPWRFSFEPGTGDLYIGDVGQNSREEIDFQPALSQGGENYGWRILEGSQCFNPAPGCLPPNSYVPPVAEYDHSLGCSVSGGYVSGGVYFYGDFCSGRIWGMKRAGLGWESALLYQAPFGISTFGKGKDGDLYVTDYGGGNIYLVKSTWRSYLPLIDQGR